MQKVGFTSTRNSKLHINFWQSVVQGVAPDGGLLVPTSLPKLSPKLLRDKKFWKSSSVSDFSTLIHKLFIPDTEISSKEIGKMMRGAHHFDLPLEELDENTFILRIDTGPTASFKDVAARSLARLLESYCAKFDKKINIVVATSGDTGVAIADAFGGSKRVSVTILYPSGGVSEIQEKQMIQVDTKYENIQSIPILGNFDLCQDVAKLLQNARGLGTKGIESFVDDVYQKLGKKMIGRDVEKLGDIVSGLNLSSANSINIWRLVPQMTQYFVAYGKLVSKGKIKAGEEIVFAVPSGNVGHLMAGIYAKLMGLPVRKFIVGTNANNILANVIGSGTIKHHTFVKTSSPSMDILDPSNLERLLHLASIHGKKRVKVDFNRMKNDIKKLVDGDSLIPLEKYGVTREMLTYLQSMIWAEDVETDEEVFAMMERVASKSGLVMEPHGVTALVATIRARGKRVVGKEDMVVVMETAHPDKFPTSLAETGLKVQKVKKHPTLSKIEKLSIQKMKRRAPISINLVEIAKQIKKIAYS